MKENVMADPAELVKLKLIFWHKGKVPGEVVEVRRDEVRSWHGFAVPVEDEVAEPAKTDDAPAKTLAGPAGKAK
jgi:hypothetical protein